MLLVSFDIHRFAAQDQLGILARQNNLDHLPLDDSQSDICAICQSVEKVRRDYDIVVYDTAGKIMMIQK